MSIEAMKQALAVLEEIANEVFSPYDNKLGDAILALRAAIKEAEKQEPDAWMYHGIRHDNTPHERPSLIWKPEYMDAMSAEKGVKATPLYADPPPRQWQGLTDEEIEMACWARVDKDLNVTHLDMDLCRNGQQNEYTALAIAIWDAAKKDWQGLTDEEIDELALDENGLPNSHIEFARAIEAKLKEENT